MRIIELLRCEALLDDVTIADYYLIRIKGLIVIDFRSV